MIFDKNQKAFPSDFHKEVWWWAGCYQWYEYFNELCEDMYNHMGIYSPVSARQYRDVLENIAANGELQGDAIFWDADDWQKYSEKLDKSKSYIGQNIHLEKCLNVLERTGLRREYKNGGVAFCNEKHPKIFHAMTVFERSPNIRKTPARHHFAHCEFRQLFKSYSANYDELLRRVSNESLYVARAIHDFAKALKIQRYVHFDTIKYKHKNMRVMDFTVTGSEYPTLRVNIGTYANPDADVSNDAFYKHLSAASEDIQDIFAKNLVGSRIQINPFKDDLDAVLCFIAARKASIDQYVI